MKKWCYVDGKIVDSSKPQIKINDLGLLRGYAVFDFIKVIKGKPLFWPEHLARFRRSARLLGLKVKLSDQILTTIVNQLLHKNKLNHKDASIRLMLTGGESLNGITPTKKEVLAVLIEDSYNLSDKIFNQGGKLITVSHARVFAEAKTTNYLVAVSLQAKKSKAGAVEILYLDQNKVLEASTSNFFAVINKKIITSRVGVLGGVTRAKIIKLAKQAGYKVEERDLKISELKQATEAFITATNKDVCPIVKIDNYKIGDGRPGEVTKQLLKSYRELIGVLK